MDTIECIKTRRSKRIFLNKEVPEGIINELIECRMNAPSSMDSQPWHFIVVKDKDLKTKLAGIKEKENQQHIQTAPLCIVVCVDTVKSPTRWIEDGVTASENILLAAHDLGIGSVYVTGFASSKPQTAEAIKNMLKLPKNIMPISILPLGYPDTSEKIENKKLVDLKKVIHQNKW